MKKILFGLLAAAAIFTGCKEHDIPIDFSVKAVANSTSLITPVPAATPRQVLVEEFTGQSCPNCPAAHTLLDGEVSQHPGLVNVISMYTPGSPQSLPPAGSTHDFENTVAGSILSSIYFSVGGLPAAGIDRVVSGNNLIQVGTSTWDGIITSELSVASPVNLTVSSSFNATTNQATIKATVTYTQAVAIPQNLSIVIVEDSIIDKQESSTGATIDNYQFNDVFRGMITSAPTGDLLQVNGSNTKEAGRVFVNTYTPTLPLATPAVNPAHCRVIAFINTTNGADKHIEQSAQCRLVN